MEHYWKKAEIDFIEKCINNGYSLLETSKIMSKEYKEEYTRAQISSVVRRYVKTGLRPKYEGYKKWNMKPIGTERKATHGYINVKIDEDTWELKHRFKYKEYHGEIPKDTVIIFANGDKTDFSKENLIAVSRRKLSVLNEHKLIKKDVEVTKTGIILADIIIKMRELEKKESI